MDYSHAIEKTLQYSDLFNYPLTKSEIWEYLIFDGKPDYWEFEKALKKFNQNRGLFFLKGKGSLVEIRNKRKIIGEKKLKLTRDVSKLLKLIPTIKFIGISGSVSMHNASLDDDIDLFIITEQGFLWTSRILVILILKIMKKHRGYGETDVKDKFCVNMFVDTNGLVFEKNLYTAHEISQLKSVEDKSKMQEQLLSKNKWINDLMPNIKIPKDVPIIRHYSLSISLLKLFRVESWAKKIQLSYMSKKISIEKINQNSLNFHPQDNKIEVLKRFNSR